MYTISHNHSKPRLLLYTILSGVLLVALLILIRQPASAQETSPISPLHPTFQLLDDAGESVLESGKPVSTMQTCGSCHDTEFIAEHSFHTSVGLDDYSDNGTVENGLPWDTSPGYFGKWNPLTYRTLTPRGSATVDLTTADWIKLFGARHVGGGPAVFSRSGFPLASLAADAGNVETSTIDPETGEAAAWNWQDSGTVEMNCFLCHLSNPNNDARIAALQAGSFKWASSATLLGTGIISQEDGNWNWNADAFDSDGYLTVEFVTIQDPTNENCGQCHGVVHMDLSTPLTLDQASLAEWTTGTTGQVISPQRLSDSGLNLSGKESLSRSWDIHTERVVACTDCHYSLNNPVYYQDLSESKPGHLIFDPRRIDIGEYLQRPLHQFAKGQSAQGTVAPDLDNTLRRCESCHSVDATHDWLPYKDKHVSSLSCESCHIPFIYAPTRQDVDWTVLQLDGSPATTLRGVDGEISSNSLINGYTPVLLSRQGNDGGQLLAPYNLVSSWFWVYGEPAQPVRLLDLQAAWFDGDSYQSDILAAFDADGNNKLDAEELRIDTAEKEALIQSRLQALGLENPRIIGEVQPYSINHDVTNGQWATKDCDTCHTEESRIAQPMLLANQMPGGVMPTFVTDSNTAFSGELVTTDDGKLYYQPQTAADDLYVLGHNNVSLIDRAGLFIFLATIVGVITHGGLRFFAARRRPVHEPELQEVYMYGVYERLWHWLQTTAILILIVTGLVIHKPHLFGGFSFKYMVQVHNVLAAVLVVNAALAVFYHLASGEIRQYLPQPRGFFSQTITQATFYIRGIFKGDEHPFDKTVDRKLNPLQQITYFSILNVLLPLQMLTGIFMWGVQRWPEVAAKLGGLPFLAPFHTIIAWLFATFIVGHVYLTTTGHKPMAGIKSMIMGWDELEVHQSSQAPATGD